MKIIQLNLNTSEGHVRNNLFRGPERGKQYL